MRGFSMVLMMLLGVISVQPCHAQEATQAPVESAPPTATDHMSMDHATEPAKTSYYAGAMEKMHKDMMVEPTGDADVDFVKGMIPHHQGAIDMAKIVIEKGKDPEIKRLAQDIVTAQEREIAMMNQWLKTHKQ